MKGDINLSVEKDSKRSAREMQRIMNHYFFMDPGVDAIIKLLDEEWFVDKLDELISLAHEFCGQFKIYFFNVAEKTGDIGFFITTIIAKQEPNELSVSQREKEIKRRINENSKIPFIVNLIEEPDEDKFKKVMNGDLEAILY